MMIGVSIKGLRLMPALPLEGLNNSAGGALFLVSVVSGGLTITPSRMDSGIRSVASQKKTYAIIRQAPFVPT